MTMKIPYERVCVCGHVRRDHVREYSLPGSYLKRFGSCLVCVCRKYRWRGEGRR